MIYIEYIISLIVTYLILLLMEIIGKILFKTKIRIHSMLIGSVLLSFSNMIRSHFELNMTDHIGMFTVTIILWIILERIMVAPEKR